MIAAISDTVPRREKTRVCARRHPKPVGAADELSRTPPGSAERGPGRDARPEGATSRSHPNTGIPAQATLLSCFPLPPSPPWPTSSPAHARGIRQTAFLLRFHTERRVRGGGAQGGAAPRCCPFPDSGGQHGARAVRVGRTRASGHPRGASRQPVCTRPPLFLFVKAVMGFQNHTLSQLLLLVLSSKPSTVPSFR